jgi:hypothetical protein
LGGSAQRRPAAAPLLARWGAVEIGSVRAGARARAHVDVENAGTVAWRSEGPRPIYAAYHWLDGLGNPIVWDGERTELPRPIDPGMRAVLDVSLVAPIPPGRYRLAVDLIAEERFWFAEIGAQPPELDVEVAPRVHARTLAVRIASGRAELTAETQRALAALDEPVVADADAAVAIAYLGAGCLPAHDWSRRVLDAHAEGYGVVAGSIEPRGGLLERRRAAKALAPWAPGGGRNPAFSRPLLCPSVLRGVEPLWEPDVESLPAARPPAGEPWLYDGRIALTAPPRSGRPRA